MSEKKIIGGDGSYEGYEVILRTLKEAREKLPKGIGLRIDSSKYLQFQFTMPSGRRIVKKTGCDLDIPGIWKAVEKAKAIHQSLRSFNSESQFWEWYEKNILGTNELIDDRITYREIFEKIETKFWESRNRNTKRKRSPDIPNDVATYNDYYLSVFTKFPDWTKRPSWDDVKIVLYHWEPGTKKFKDAYAVVKKVCSLAPNSESLLSQLSQIDNKQVEFKKRQSISLQQFLDWHQQTLDNAISEKNLEVREKWLWVCSMCVVYGLRPSEVAAILNLDKPYYEDGIPIQALNDSSNKKLLIVLGETTYFGTTIKTGSRVCLPLISDDSILERLQIQKPKLPEYQPKSSNPDIIRGFVKSIRHRLISWKCPVTEVYAFRHLGNQLGEMYGIPQEIRSRSMGHSTLVNDSVYKSRTNLQTTVDLLTKHSKLPLDYEAACKRLQALGFDLLEPSVKAILKVIYQLD